MEHSGKEVTWSPRVSMDRLRRLYQSVGRGIWDEELIDDVGMTLYMRCRDILSIHRAQFEGTVTCPRCQRSGTDTLIDCGKKRDEVMTCPVCGWSMTWIEYHRTFQRRQLNPGGAVAYFEEFVSAYGHARDPKKKMLAIDRVIHEFHYSIRELPDQPTRAAGVNLINGRLTDVIRFLDELSSMDLPDVFQDSYRSWRDRQDSIRWDDILEKKKNSRQNRG